MGLRGATIFFPLLFAVFLRKYELRRSGALSIFIAPACVIIAGLMHLELLPPLYFGLSVSLALLIFGYLQRKAQRQ